MFYTISKQKLIGCSSIAPYPEVNTTYAIGCQQKRILNTAGTAAVLVRKLIRSINQIGKSIGSKAIYIAFASFYFVPCLTPYYTVTYVYFTL